MNKMNKIPTRRIACYLMSIGFIVEFNMFFGLFVWNTYDLAPNQAIGFISLLVIWFIIYNWRKDMKEAKIK